MKYIRNLAIYIVFIVFGAGIGLTIAGEFMEPVGTIDGVRVQLLDTDTLKRGIVEGTYEKHIHVKSYHDGETLFVLSGGFWFVVPPIIVALLFGWVAKHLVKRLG